MAESEHSKLAEKLDKELDDYIAQLKPKKYEDGWPEDKWEEEMEKHPIFMSKPVSEGQELPPLVEALQKLKYDPEMNTPEELAAAYKEDGNENFKLKKYRWAVESYTHGLKLKCKDQELNAQLYANRSAAHYHIGNFQKSLKDATEAKLLKPGYMKAIVRGALCCWKLKLFKDCLFWCEEGLMIDENNSQLQDLKKKSNKEKDILEETQRMKLIEAAQKQKETDALISAIKKREICIADNDTLDLSDLEPLHPALSQSKVHLHEDGCLIWPVMILYPEYGVTDYIQQFHENTCFDDHLSVMFNEENRPSWDVDNVYYPENLQIYFNHYDDGLVTVSKNKMLKSILSDKRFRIHGGTPSFFITVKNSLFDKEFRRKNMLKTS